MRTVLAVIFTVFYCSDIRGNDFFLTIGGGYSPSGNQASIENNVLYAQRVLSAGPSLSANHIYFSDGNGSTADVEVLDRDSVPKANRLMAEFFGSETNLGLSYRNHQLPNVRGATSPQNIRRWFSDVGSTMNGGDRLFIYVTAHGGGSRDRANDHETTIAMWNNSSLKMTEFVELLDDLPTGVEVVCVMVQCHAGGFARLIFKGGDPEAGLSSQKRIGFFATVHDRPAAGCTSEVDEKSYVEYSTYFWAALSGKDRLGKSIEKPDYDGDGKVSFEEAHAYVILFADTIDLPLKSSGEFLTKYGRYGRKGSSSLPDDAEYSDVLSVASPVQKAILDGLSQTLDLQGDDRIMEAYRKTRSGGSNSRSRRRPSARPESRVKATIARDLKRRWPALANLMNPDAIELVTTRKSEFVRAVETHGSYEEYCKLIATDEMSDQKRRVKYERFLRVVDNVIFAENLRREKRTELRKQYDAIVAAERETLFD